jgi:pectate lyase
MNWRAWLSLACLPLAAHGQQADGWASMHGGTRGGGAAAPTIVSTASELRTALAAGHTVIHILGMIDMGEGRPFVNSADQRKRGTIKLASNSTLAGAGIASGLINASVQVAQADNVIIRNLNLRNPCDVGPVWDAADGDKGNWNSLFDAISVSASTHVWIDHNSFTDAPSGDQQAPIENGMLKQCHDGALDINLGSDLITISNNRFSLHQKNTLIGSSDNAVGDIGKLRITFSNNLFEHVSERAPRVRFGQVHLYNNLHVGARQHPVYAHKYSVGLGKHADIISEANVYAIDGARHCRDVIRTWHADSSFADQGSLLNGAPLAGCSQIARPGWQVPYPFTSLAAGQVAEHVLATAGAGNWHVETDGAGGMLALAAGAAFTPPAESYYVQARIRARRADGQIFLLGRYLDGEWQGAGLSLTNDALELRLASQRKGILATLKQVRLAESARSWHLLRVELNGTTLTVYLNGEKISSAQDAALPQLRGSLGIYSIGNAFEIDDLRVGPATDKPARITPLRSSNIIRMQAGDAARRVAISALAGDGVTPLAMRAVSTRPKIATVAVDAGHILIGPRQAGKASVILASVADPAVETALTVQIGPRFTMPRRTLRGAVWPAAGARDVPVDTPLRLQLARPAPPGATGSVRIFRQRDMVLVDTIYPGDEVRAIGPPGAGRQRHARQHAIRFDQRGATISLHSGVLEYGTQYLVAIGDGVVDGISGKWSFRTRERQPTGAVLRVDDDGAADFRTVQGALDHAMARTSRSTPLTVEVGNGDYEELLFLRERDRITIRGESRDGVMIHATNNEGMNRGNARALLLVDNSDLLTLDTLTLRNDTQRRHSLSGQAEALLFDSPAGRLSAFNANFISEQDTLQLKGTAWFHETLVAGNVDFIWGANRVALFERSEIRTLGDSSDPSNGGYIVQARTPEAGNGGFIFLDSSLTHGPGPAGNDVPAGSTYLARSAGLSTAWDNVAFINCRMGKHVASAGWAGAGVAREPRPRPVQADAEHGWREFGSTTLDGLALDLSERKGPYLMAPDEAARLTHRANILGISMH